MAQISTKTVNEFTEISRSDYSVKPPCNKYKNILGYNTYISTVESNIYIVFDHNNNAYHTFRYTGNLVERDVDNDLSKRIESHPFYQGWGILL